MHSAAHVLAQVPPDVALRVALALDYDVVRALRSTCAAIAAMLDSGEYWRLQSAPLRVHGTTALRSIIDDASTAAAQRIALVDVDDDGVCAAAGHFACLTHVSLATSPAVSEHGVAAMVAAHGRSLVALDLSSMPQLVDETLASVGAGCPSLAMLDIARCSFSAAGLQALVSGPAGRSLIRLRIARCYMLACSQLPQMLTRSLTPRLRIVDASNLDFLTPEHVREVAENCALSLRKINVRGCADITLRGVRDIRAAHSDALKRAGHGPAARRARRLLLLHDATLEDHSIEGVRRFLLGLVGHPI